jgi:hypothetical protein
MYSPILYDGIAQLLEGYHLPCQAAAQGELMSIAVPLIIFSHQIQCLATTCTGHSWLVQAPHSMIKVAEQGTLV